MDQNERMDRLEKLKEQILTVDEKSPEGRILLKIIKDEMNDIIKNYNVWHSDIEEIGGKLVDIRQIIEELEDEIAEDKDNSVDIEKLSGDFSYKDVIKDEESLKKYLNNLVLREDIDIRNKIFSAALAGRFFEKERYFWDNKDNISTEFMKSMGIDRKWFMKSLNMGENRKTNGK